MTAFVEEVFRPLPRADQRHWARTYLRGLLCAPGRASARQLAAAQSLPGAAAHGLHQFVNGSTWAWEPVRQALARQICARAVPVAWVVVELFFPRQGHSTVGVYSAVEAGTGQPVSGQRVLGLFLCTEAGSFPVSWRLLLRDAWIKDRQRRLRARVPKAATARPRWAYLMEFVDEVTRGQLPELPWIFALPLAPADVLGLLGTAARRRLAVLCEVTPDQRVHSGDGRAAASTVRELLSHERVRSAPVRLGTRGPANPGHRPYQAIRWSPPGGRSPDRYVLTSLGPRHGHRMLAHATAHTVAAAAAVSSGFGVRDFPGRSFPGWHHHMTMASAAYAYRHLPPESLLA